MASKYVEDNLAVIIQHLEAGHTDKAAYTAARVSSSQFYKWQRMHPEFEERVRAAKNRAHIAITNKLLELVKKGNPGATIFWLKCRFPEDWRDRSEVIHSGTIGTYEDRITKIRQRQQARKVKNGAGSGKDTTG